MRAILVILILLTSVKAHAVGFTLVDGLNGLAPSIRLSIFGSGGPSITLEQTVGPAFRYQNQLVSLKWVGS